MIRFDVFGRLVGVRREGDAWQVYYLVGEGKRVVARDLIVPPDLPESGLARAFADLAHERATPAKPDVTRLDP